MNSYKGFGSSDMSGATGYDPQYQGQEVYELEGEDDTYGSGIFDPSGRKGTSNPNMGVFASHDSLPGYIARDVPFTVSRDVTDITDDADVVSIPGGGMYYVERGGKNVGAAIMGPTWKPPQIEPAGYTRHDQVYVDMTARSGKGTWLNAGAPVTGPPQLSPDRVQRHVYDVPGEPPEQQVPFSTDSQGVPKRSIVAGGQVPVAIERYRDPVAASAPGMPMDPGVPFTSTTNVDVQQIPLTGFGIPNFSSLQHMRPSASLLPPGYTSLKRRTPGGVFGEPEENEPTSPQRMAVYGLLSGVAVGLLYGLVKNKGKRGKGVFA